MTVMMFSRAKWIAAVSAFFVAGAIIAAQERPSGQGFSFRTGVELINITATVTDQNGRFVPSLRSEDFTVYEDGQPQPVQQFDAERVPVSLGIALDTSGSMIGEKMVAAQAALNRFLFDLLGDQDEVFLYRFDSRPELVAGWTENRRAVARELGTIKPNGGTAIFDTTAAAVQLAQQGTRRKKALVIISDGNDTSSQMRFEELGPIIRKTEVLVYAIGIDASGESTNYQPAGPPRPPGPVPVPSPFPGKPGLPQTPRTPKPANRPSNPKSNASVDRLNVETLRRITDESGGRTEIIVSPRDLDPATASVADELSRQYFLGYSSSAPKDGRWHTIEVRLNRPGTYTVRARRGFISN